MRMDVPRGPDATTLLVRATRALAVADGLEVAVRSIASRPWASATFVGLQHRMILDAPPSTALGAWIAALPEAEWSMRGHLVADVVVDSRDLSGDVATFALTILTIEEDRTA